MDKRKLLFSLLLLLLLCSGVAQATIPSGERIALLALYNSTDGDSWINNSGWLGAAGTECSWYGVTCDGGETTTTRIHLADNNLSGVLPTELGDLTNLEMLNLQENQLTGPIPPELGNMTALQGLYLHQNQLTDSIPPELGTLVNLQQLFVSDNQLTGSIPTELGNLTSMQELSLSDNQLTGSIPPELSNLANLRGLSLYRNQLTGPIAPELGNLANLQRLFLSNNQLTGKIPPELGNLANLQRLSLSNNQLTSKMPPELGNLANLTMLQLHANQLTGAIPPELGILTHLTSLHLAYNQLSGPLPASFINLTNLRNDSNNFSYNALYTTDPALDAFLDSKQSGGDWSATQTVAPSNVTATNRTTSTVDLQWNLIEYSSHDGGYYIYYGTQPGGPYPHEGGPTANKSTDHLSLSGLAPPPQPHYFVMRTRTDPHSHVWQNNTVWSGHSNQVCVPTGAPDDADCDGLADRLDRDRCSDAALMGWSNETYQGSGNTRLSSGVRIATDTTGNIITAVSHRLILKAPEVVIRSGVTFRVENGAELLIYSQPDVCL